MSGVVCLRCGSDDLVRRGLLVYCERGHRVFGWLLSRRRRRWAGECGAARPVGRHLVDAGRPGRARREQMSGITPVGDVRDGLLQLRARVQASSVGGSWSSPSRSPRGSDARNGPLRRPFFRRPSGAPVVRRRSAAAANRHEHVNLVLVRVVLHRGECSAGFAAVSPDEPRAHPRRAPSRPCRSSRAPRPGRRLHGGAAPGSQPPCVTITTVWPSCAAAIRSTVATTRSVSSSLVSPSWPISPPRQRAKPSGNRSSTSARVRPDQEPTSISRSPRSRTTSRPRRAPIASAVSLARRRSLE